MNSVPSNPTPQEIETEEEESSWTDFFLPVVLLAFAVVPFTPLWEQLADPDSTRRKYGAVSRFLDSVGPVPVALTFAGLGLLLVIGEIVQRSRRDDSTAPGRAQA